MSGIVSSHSVLSGLTAPDWASLLSILSRAEAAQTEVARWLTLLAQVTQAQAAGVRLSAGGVVWESVLPLPHSAAPQRRHLFELGELRGELILWGGVEGSAEERSVEAAAELQPQALAALARLLRHLSGVSSAPTETPKMTEAAKMDMSELEDAATEDSATLPPLSDALSHFGDGMGVFWCSAETGDPEPRLLHVNSAWLHQTGFTAPELSGRPLWSLLGPDTSVQTLERLRDSVRLGRSVRAQVSQLHKGGRSVWADLSLSPVTDGRGDLTHWLAHWSAARRRAVSDPPGFSPSSGSYGGDSPGTDRAQVWELAANNAPLVQVLARLVNSVERQFEGQRAVIVLPDVLPEEPPTIFTARGEAGQSDWLALGRAASAAQTSAQWTQPITSSTGHLLGTLRVHGQTEQGQTEQSQIAAAPDADARAKLEAAAGLAALVMERSASQAVLERLALYDALTGLPNRVLFERELERALTTTTVPGAEQPIGVALMDLDRFKTINDTLGHSVGDALLQQVAGRLRGALEPGDLLARMGGDEFLLLMGRPATPQQVQQMAGRLLHTFSQPFVLAGREIFMQLSVGFSVLPRRSARTELLIQQADSAMYQAKRQGGGYALYRTGAGEPLTAMTLESGLHRALERREFRLDYQPQLDTRTGELVGAEALLRWQHPELGLILPGEFIPLAEVTGLIVPIGAWVLRQACLQAAAWVARVPHLRMAVNLSARQFQRPDLIETVTRALTAARLEAHHLELELTESMLVQAQHAESTLERLKDLGVRVVVDDFGTGYSNLAYLKQYPIDALKIDATFTANVGGELAAAIRDEVLVKAVMNLAHALDLAVTVEGVERPEQLDFLRRHNCDYVQGYLLGPPQQAEALMKAFPQLAPPAVPDPQI